jgi:hypothetical protein
MTASLSDDERLEALRATRAAMDEVPDHVAALRRARVGWPAIAEALGVTRQAARQRYDAHAQQAALEFLPGDPEVLHLTHGLSSRQITRPAVLVWMPPRREHWTVEAVMPATWDPDDIARDYFIVDSETHPYREERDPERRNKLGGRGAYVPVAPDDAIVHAAVDRMTESLRTARRPTPSEAGR